MLPNKLGYVENVQVRKQLQTAIRIDGMGLVAINTVQRAITELQREGLVYGIQGKGNFVRSDIDADTITTSSPDLKQQIRGLNDELNKVKKRVAKLERKSKVVD